MYTAILMNTAERIKHRMAELGLKGVDVTSTLGLSSGGISQWTKGLHKPSGSNLIRLAKLLKCSPEWILGNTDDLEPIEAYPSISPSQPNSRLIPVVSWKKAASLGSHHDSLESVDVLDWVPAFTASSAGSFALAVHGNSMVSPYPGEKSYPDGTMIYIDPQKEVNPDMRVIATIPSYETPVFRSLVNESGKLFLKPLNPQYPVIEVTDETQILGVVIGSYFPE